MSDLPIIRMRRNAPFEVEEAPPEIYVNMKAVQNGETELKVVAPDTLSLEAANGTFVYRIVERDLHRMGLSCVARAMRVVDA